MFTLSSLFRSLRRRKAAKESDYGRRFGWFIEKDGVKIGELEYVRWLPDGQFWHEYRVTWYKSEDAVGGRDVWSKERLTLRNRRFLQVVVESFMTSATGGELIQVRGACVPEVLFTP
jgi:hypothetical protein